MTSARELMLAALGAAVLVGLTAVAASSTSATPKPGPKPGPQGAVLGGVRHGVAWRIIPGETGLEGWIELDGDWGKVEGAVDVDLTEVKLLVFGFIDAVFGPQENPDESPPLPPWEGGPVPPIPTDDEPVEGEQL